MRILVTGGTGFLGKNIQENLGAFLNQDYSISTIGSEVYDLRCQQACRKVVQYYNPDVILHAAGSVGGIGANQENPGKFMYDNLIMGANLIERARIENVQKFVLLGTVCAYPKYTPVPFKEEDLWNGYPEETNAPYGIAKKTLMKMLQTYKEQYGMRGANLIPVNMYGPHDHFNLTSSHVIPALILKFYNAMKNGDEVELWGTGSASREFLYASDCVEAIARAIETDVDLEPINIGTGKEITIKELAKEIAEQMGYEGQIKWQTDKPDGQPRRCLDTSKAKKLLDFEAKTDLQTGLKQTIEWFLNDKNLEQ
jgi:GDP-L-fucose synthase|tara:strand:- start:875 stop:1807 length:933 start_codon:yes stop_codon:yes gene_type:complete